MRQVQVIAKKTEQAVTSAGQAVKTTVNAAASYAVGEDRPTPGNSAEDVLQVESMSEVPFTDDAAVMLGAVHTAGAETANAGRTGFASSLRQSTSMVDAERRRDDFELHAATAAAIDQSKVRSLYRIRTALTAIAANRSKIPRILIIACLILQLVLLVIACAIAGMYRDTVPENLRTFCLVLALFATAAVFQPLAPIDKLKAKMRATAALKCLSLIFEMQCYAVARDWQTLFIVGSFIVALTLLVFLLCLVAAKAMTGYDPDDSEMLYTVYAAGHEDIQKLGDDVAPAIKAIVLSTAEKSGGNASFEDILSAARSAIGDELKSSTAEYVDTETEHLAARDEQEIERVINANTHFDQRNLDPRQVSNWYAANRIRKKVFDRDTAGVSVTVSLLVLLFVFALGNVTYEFAKIFANQPPLFSPTLNHKYNANGPASFGATRSHSAWKVHMVVVDGLRYDLTEPGASAIGDLFAASAFAANSVRLKMIAQIPSFSVPNWMTLLSGAPPEQTGITGNLLASETSYDHIFRLCEKYGLHSGLTGTPWWRDLVFSSVPTLDGDGTIWSDFTPGGTPAYGWDTNNPGDEARLNVALTAAVRSGFAAPFGAAGATNLYEFFLTHFSDVDKQGHEYGIDTKYNTLDTYMGAIANKTAAIQQIINAIDNQTVLIITSDHGHVKRGGHGGVSEVLRDVPIVFYTKGSPLAAAPLAAFPADAGPRFGEYQNTDFAATVCALLGIPAPRQTTGVFMEEIIRSLVPATAQLKHYDDLMRARYSLVEEMLEHIGANFWGNLTKGSELEDPEILALKAMTTPAGTPQQYGNAIRKLDGHYQRLRDNLALFDLMRNLIASLFMLVPGLLFILAVAENLTIASLSSIFDRHSRCRQPNVIACIKGFITVFLHIALSLAVFLIGYFGVTGYSVWDSTLTHTPSVAVTFLSRTVVAPVFIFVLLTRAFLFTSIRWYSLATIREFKEIFLTQRVEDDPGATEPKGAADDENLNQSQVAAAEPLKFSHLVVIGWIGNAIRDVIVFVFGTSRYRRAAFADAYLYLYYVAMWSAVAAFLLLFMCFPFSFMVPVVFAIPYVSEFNAEWRFRMITMLMLVLPLLVGTALLLYLRPKLDANTVLLWDQVLLDLDMSDEVARLRARLDALVEELEEELEKTGDERKPERIIDLRMQQRDVRGRIKLAARAAGYVMDSTFTYTDDSLPESTLFRDDAQKADQRLFDGDTEAAKKALVY